MYFVEHIATMSRVTLHSGGRSDASDEEVDNDVTTTSARRHVRYFIKEEGWGGGGLLQVRSF